MSMTEGESPSHNRVPESPQPGGWWAIPRPLVLASILLAIAFSLPLFRLVRFAVGSSLYSHIVLIPFVSALLVWFRRERWPGPSTPHPTIASILLLSGGAALASWGVTAWSGTALPTEDHLALSILPCVLLFAAACAWFLGRATLRTIAFPLCFLVFMLPFPVGVEAAIEAFFQQTSASAAQAFFQLAGTPVFREGQVLNLPGIQPLEVARECSGIHSSLVLFIVSLVAGDMMLQSWWKRVALTLFVIPLGIARNGFRIFVLGQLCVYDDPEWIHSRLHHQGGPIFFALSLVPMFAVLWLLWRSDRSREHA